MLIAGVSASFGYVRPAQAVELDESTQLLSTKKVPLELGLLQGGALPADGSITTSNTISQLKLTIPSLWWTDDQFGGKVLEHWIAYSGENGTIRRIDLVVNQQIWSLYNYLERYTFLSHFGTAARDFGYSLRVFNQRQDLMAAYVCEFPLLEETNQPSLFEGVDAPVASEDPVTPDPSANSPLPNCQVYLESAGAGGLRGQSQRFGGLETTNDDTAQ